WADNTHNAMGLVEQQHSGFEVSSEGQYAFFRAVVETAQYAGAAGIFYWGGEWVAVDTQDEHGSAWENQALFDFDGNPLPALNVYREMAEGNKP
ncbi:MAG: glycosyl hydrolase 53 family protein, partial [Chloroflexota bacterium]